MSQFGIAQMHCGIKLVKESWGLIVEWLSSTMKKGNTKVKSRKKSDGAIETLPEETKTPESEWRLLL